MRAKLTVLFSAFFLFMMITNINFVSAAYGDSSCNPVIKIVSQDPIPSIPDSYVKLIFEVSNLGNCYGFAVKLNPEYPFSLDTGSDSIQTIENIPSSSGYKSAWDVPYKIRIASDALDGEYNLKLTYHEGSGRDFETFAIEKMFNITIQDSRTKFDAVIQESAGSDVSIAIANIGKYTANSVVVRIPEQESFIVSGTDGQMVGNLESGDYTIVGFSVASKVTAPRNMTRGSSPSNSPVQSSNLKFDVYYTDNIGERRIVNMELPLNSGNSTMMSGFPGRKTSSSSWSSWYTILIILVIFIGGCWIYKKYPKKIRDFLSKIISKKPDKSLSKIPDWIKNAREKVKK